MIRSMTGYASRKGGARGWSWNWEVRAVNGRGFDLRLRLPEGIEGLEPAVRKALKPAVARGNVTLSLRLQRDLAGGDDPAEGPGQAGGAPFAADAGALPGLARLDRLLASLRAIEERALTRHDLELAPSSALDVLSARALSGGGIEPHEAAALLPALCADLDALLAAFNDMRAGEGAALEKLLRAQLARIDALAAQAARQADKRREHSARTLRENLARVLKNSDGADPDRVAQELALIAVKSDVTEELDRLHAHADAARDLLDAGGAVGRRLDFLAQEFNREANTLCSKAQFGALTRIGLDLKAVIDQMREQVQNVE